jgi:hypothetical protein
MQLRRRMPGDTRSDHGHLRQLAWKPANNNPDDPWRGNGRATATSRGASCRFAVSRQASRDVDQDFLRQGTEAAPFTDNAERGSRAGQTAQTRAERCPSGELGRARALEGIGCGPPRPTPPPLPRHGHRSRLREPTTRIEGIAGRRTARKGTAYRGFSPCAAGSSRHSRLLGGAGPTVVQIARDVVVRRKRDRRRDRLGAARHRVRASRAEPAARGRVHRIRRIAGDGWTLEAS